MRQSASWNDFLSGRPPQGTMGMTPTTTPGDLVGESVWSRPAGVPPWSVTTPDRQRQRERECEGSASGRPRPSTSSSSLPSDGPGSATPAVPSHPPPRRSRSFGHLLSLADVTSLPDPYTSRSSRRGRGPSEEDDGVGVAAFSGDEAWTGLPRSWKPLHGADVGRSSPARDTDDDTAPEHGHDRRGGFFGWMGGAGPRRTPMPDASRSSRAHGGLGFTASAAERDRGDEDGDPSDAVADAGCCHAASPYPSLEASPTGTDTHSAASFPGNTQPPTEPGSERKSGSDRASPDDVRGSSGMSGEGPYVGEAAYADVSGVGPFSLPTTPSPPAQGPSPAAAQVAGAPLGPSPSSPLTAATGLATSPPGVPPGQLPAPTASGARGDSSFGHSMSMSSSVHDDCSSQSSDASLYNQYQRRLAREVAHVLARAARCGEVAQFCSPSSTTSAADSESLTDRDAEFTERATLLEGLGYNISCPIEPDVLARLGSSSWSVVTRTPVGSVASPPASPLRPAPRRSTRTATPSRGIRPQASGLELPPQHAPFHSHADENPAGLPPSGTSVPTPVASRPLEPSTPYSVASTTRPVPQFYFQLLADYYLAIRGSKSFFRMKPHWEALCAQEAFAPIFALLFHKWMLGARTRTPLVWDEEVSTWFMLLVSGANRVFWSDVHSCATQFKPLFEFLASVVCQDVPLANVPYRPRMDLHTVVVRFFLYYQESTELLPFLRHLPRLFVPSFTPESLLAGARAGPNEVDGGHGADTDASGAGAGAGAGGDDSDSDDDSDDDFDPTNGNGDSGGSAGEASDASYDTSSGGEEDEDEGEDGSDSGSDSDGDLSVASGDLAVTDEPVLDTKRRRLR